MPDPTIIDAGKTEYAKVSRITAREFLVWVSSATAYGSVMALPAASDNLKAWAMISLALVSSAFILGRFWLHVAQTKNPTP